MSVNVILPKGTDYRPGDEVPVNLSWKLDKEPRRINVNLFWFTDGKGSRDVGLVDSHLIDRPARQGDRRFTFVLPSQPLSFSGRLITLTWAVEVLVQGSAETATVEFLLSRDGHEIRLRPDAPE